MMKLATPAQMMIDPAVHPRQMRRRYQESRLEVPPTSVGVILLSRLHCVAERDIEQSGLALDLM